MIVAIDGPAGVGKSSLARRIAEDAGFFYLNSGEFYRAVTFSVLQQGLPPEESLGVLGAARALSLEIEEGRLVVDGVPRDRELHTDAVDSWVAKHSAIVEVRKVINEHLRRIGGLMDIVAEGRDVTTVVFPGAEVKVFLDAAVEVRARRRYEQGTSGQTLEELRESIKARDEIDRNKSFGGLKIAPDAIYLDTSDLTIDEVCDKVVTIIRKKK